MRFALHCKRIEHKRRRKISFQTHKIKYLFQHLAFTISQNFQLLLLEHTRRQMVSHLTSLAKELAPAVFVQAIDSSKQTIAFDVLLYARQQALPSTTGVLANVELTRSLRMLSDVVAWTSPCATILFLKTKHMQLVKKSFAI